MYSTAEKIFNLSNDVKIKNCGQPIFRESFSQNLDHSVPPEDFGPPLWTSLHYMAKAYEDNPSKYVKEMFKNFLMALPFILPCSQCRQHCLAVIEGADLEKVVSNRTELFKFFFNFHNAVNKRLGKPEMSYEQAVAKYNF